MARPGIDYINLSLWPRRSRPKLTMTHSGGTHAARSGATGLANSGGPSAWNGSVRMVFGSSLASVTGALVALVDGRLGWLGGGAGVSWRAGVAWYGWFCGRACLGRVRALGSGAVSWRLG